MNAEMKPVTNEEAERIRQIREAVEDGVEALREGRTSPLNIKKTIQRAIENARQGRKVNPLVSPEDH